MRIALGLEYDGSRFLGWQTQAGGGAVQDAVQAALSGIADAPVAVTCADGRKEIYTANEVVSSAPIRELMQSISPTPIMVLTMPNWKGPACSVSVAKITYSPSTTPTALNAETIAYQGGIAKGNQIILAVIALVLILEATRRVIGWILPILVGAALVAVGIFGVERACLIDYAAQLEPVAGIPPLIGVALMRSLIRRQFEAMVIESFTTARAYGVEDAVVASLYETFPGIDWEKQGAYYFQRVIEHGRRRAEEVREVAETVREAGLTPWSAQGTAERGNVNPEIAVLDERLGPDATHQLLIAQQLTGALNEQRLGQAIAAVTGLALIVGGGVTIVLFDSHRLIGATVVFGGICGLAVLLPLVLWRGWRHYIARDVRGQFTRGAVHTLGLLLAILRGRIPTGGEPQPVTVGAERLAHTCDDAHGLENQLR